MDTCVSTDTPTHVEDWMRVLVFKEMKERLALSTNDEAAIGPYETLRELNEAAALANPPRRTDNNSEAHFLEQFFSLRIAPMAKDPCDPELPKWMKAQRIARRLTEGFQRRVSSWCEACFGYSELMDKGMRNRRFLEEALELVQACDLPREQAIAMVEYVYARPVGLVPQEVGGVMTTLAALCVAQSVDMMQEADNELLANWRRVPEIRHKSAMKDSVLNTLTQGIKPPVDRQNALRWEAVRNVPVSEVETPGTALLVVNQGTVEEPKFVAYTGADADHMGDHAILLARAERLLQKAVD